MTRGSLNKTLHNAFRSLITPRSTTAGKFHHLHHQSPSVCLSPCIHFCEYRQADSERSNTPQVSGTAEPAQPNTSITMVETPATAARSAEAPALPVAVQALVVVPVASSIPADAPAPISEASIPELVAENAEASADSLLNQLLPYLTAAARHQVQLSIWPPHHNHLATQRRRRTGGHSATS
ncbi:hypothetical protein JG687_00014613 [Phytophthora cactorum]|uniref:Uncharacterized protein n=1 Tax=Phytophthora cactorum TaxID=29920 RepID=A0A8T1U0B5_9STRA|nr:hypothetical protein JG687_00014613 [Phytophthora cactorum]